MNKTVKFLLLISCFFVTSVIHSQTSETKTYNLVTSSDQIGIGFSNILDPYLSPYDYTGLNLTYRHQSQSYLSENNDKTTFKSDINLQLARLYHPTKINVMLYANGNIDLGILYNIRPLKNIKIGVGGSWDMALGGKYIARNVNNPFSLDLFTDINGAINADYKFNISFFNWFSQDFRVEYGVRTPLAGVMFVAPQGESYYEIFSLENSANSVHFSCLNNKRAIYQHLYLDIPVKFTTFRIGINNDLLQYRANNMTMHNYNYAITIGMVYNFYVFNGAGNKAPQNFKNSY